MSILDVEINDDDSGAETIREYFKALLVALFEEGEGFSGKRPFGNSGWEYSLMAGLIKSGHVKGELDHDGYVDSCDDKKFYKLINEAIGEL